MVHGFLVLLGVVAVAGCGRAGFDPVHDAGPAGAPARFRDLCAFTRVAVVENGLAIDDAAGAALSSALVAGCGIEPALRTVSQDMPGILDPSTDRPLLPADELAIIGGGDGPNRAIAYLHESDTPVVWIESSFVTYLERATGRTIAEGPTSASHDYALVMVVSEPIGNSRVLSASGMVGNGTVAAAAWFATEIAPTIGTNAAGWTLVEWTNADADPAPSEGDSFDVIESGP